MIWNINFAGSPYTVLSMACAVGGLFLIKALPLSASLNRGASDEVRRFVTVGAAGYI